MRVEEENSFLKKKELIARTPALTLPDHNNPFIIETDASKFAIGGVLLQENSNSYEHPVAYFSKKILPAETNYPVYDKEMLAIFRTIQEFQHYLQNACFPFTVQTDHRSIKYLNLPQHLI